MSGRIGILGGMFDPVHKGHIGVALAAREALHLDEVRLIPCGIPNHRDRALCSPLQRLDMLRLATRDHPGLIVDDRELNRPGTSYSYDTLVSLRQEHPGATLFFILGQDAFAGLPRWHRWQELFTLCHLVVIRRPDADSSAPGELAALLQSRRVAEPDRLTGARAGLVFEMPGLESPVSSSLVRERIAHDGPLQDLLDPAVARYLAQHQLYRKAVDNG
jgi:nicotinate-nucleotide adenylyltransferase